MRSRLAFVLLASIAGAGSLFLVRGAAVTTHAGKNHPASQSGKLAPGKLIIDYPLEGSIFPPEITPPTFLFHDSTETAKRWVVEVSFAGRSNRIRVEAPGELMQVGRERPRRGSGCHSHSRAGRNPHLEAGRRDLGEHQAPVGSIAGDHHNRWIRRRQFKPAGVVRKSDDFNLQWIRSALPSSTATFR